MKKIFFLLLLNPLFSFSQNWNGVYNYSPNDVQSYTIEINENAARYEGVGVQLFHIWEMFPVNRGLDSVDLYFIRTIDGTPPSDLSNLKRPLVTFYRKGHKLYTILPKPYNQKGLLFVKQGGFNVSRDGKDTFTGF